MKESNKRGVSKICMPPTARGLHKTALIHAMKTDTLSFSYPMNYDHVRLLEHYVGGLPYLLHLTL